MRVVFMGTPPFAVPMLEAFDDTAHEVTAIYTAPPKRAKRGQSMTRSAVHEAALARDLPVYTPASLRDDEAQAMFEAHAADIAVVVAYGLLLPRPILAAYPHGCLNIHPSDLPRWRGAAPIQRTVMADDRHTAICIMQMDEGLDTGPVWLREPVTLETEETAGSLQERLSLLAPPLVLQTLEMIAAGTGSPAPQAEEGVTYAAKIRKEECALSFTGPAKEVRDHIHGLSPSPGAYGIYNGERLRLLDVSAADGDAQAQPGTVLDAELRIQCGEGAIIPRTVQRPGKRAMTVEECLRGLSIPPGTNLSAG